MLPKAYRLKEKRDFNQAYRRGHAVASAAFVLHCRRKRPGSQPRVGFSVSKKIGNAVTRNRVRRRFRHAAAALLSELPPGCDYVFVVRSPALGLSFAGLKAAMRKAVEKAAAPNAPAKARQ